MIYICVSVVALLLLCVGGYTCKKCIGEKLTCLTFSFSRDGKRIWVVELLSGSKLPYNIDYKAIL